MIALSDTLLGPSACVAAMTSSFEGFSLKMSLSESALFVSSGSRLENLKERSEVTLRSGMEPQISEMVLRIAPSSHQIEAILFKSCAEDRRVRLQVLQGWVVGCFHFNRGRHFHGGGDALKEAQLDHTDVLQLPQDPDTSDQQRKHKW